MTDRRSLHTPFWFARATVGGATGLLLACAAQAHDGHAMSSAVHAHAASVMDAVMLGALHPLSGLDHLAAMVCVGAWSALNSPSGRDNATRFDAQRLLAAPTAFAATLLLGALLGMAGLNLPGIEPMIAASLLVLGLLVATRLRLDAKVGALLVAVFALFHGMAHGNELVNFGAGAAWAMGGMVLSTVALHGLGMAAGLLLRDRASGGPSHARASGFVGRWASRLAGGAVALFGLSLLTPAIAAAL